MPVNSFLGARLKFDEDLGEQFDKFFRKAVMAALAQIGRNIESASSASELLTEFDNLSFLSEEVRPIYMGQLVLSESDEVEQPSTEVVPTPKKPVAETPQPGKKGDLASKAFKS